MKEDKKKRIRTPSIHFEKREREKNTYRILNTTKKKTILDMRHFSKPWMEEISPSFIIFFLNK
jgi:hypothetical protein